MELKESLQPVIWVAGRVSFVKTIVAGMGITYECEFVLYRIDFAIIFYCEIQ